MISRRSLFKWGVSLVALLSVGVSKSKATGEFNPWHDFNKFNDTSYLKRMCLETDGEGNKWGPGHIEYDRICNGTFKKFDFINKQVLEFREQKPFVPEPDKRKIRYQRHPWRDHMIIVKHDDRLRDQIRDAIKEHLNG